MFLKLCLIAIGVYLSYAYSVDNIPISSMIEALYKDVDSNVSPLENNFIKLNDITKSLTTKFNSSTGAVLCDIPQMLHIFGNIYGNIQNLVIDVKNEWPSLVNKNNPPKGAIKIPANIMEQIYNALVEVEPVLGQLDEEFQLDEKLVTGICTAYKTIGSHGNGLLYLQNNLASRVLNLTHQIVESNEQAVVIINAAIAKVNQFQNADNKQKSIGVLATMGIKILENVVESVEKLVKEADTSINNSVARNFIVKQITSTEQTMNIDVTVHHTLILFEHIALSTQKLIAGLKLIQNMLPDLEEVMNIK